MALQENKPEEKIALLKTNYDVTQHNFISFNVLLNEGYVKNKKRSTKKTFIVLTVTEIIYYTILVHNKNFNMGILTHKNLVITLSIIWLLGMISFVYMNFLFNILLARKAKKMYLSDEYSNCRINLEIFEDRLIETAVNTNSVLFSEITSVHSNQEIYAFTTNKGRSFIIPKNKETEEAIRLIEGRLKVKENSVHTGNAGSGSKSTKNILKEMFS